MDDRLDKIVSDINDIKLDLREHMHRTNQNEAMIKELTETLHPMAVAYQGVKWTAGVLVGLATCAIAIYEYFPKH